MLLHVPIGVLIALAACEGWARLRDAPLDRAQRLVLVTLALGSTLAAGVSGWTLAGEPSYAPSSTLTLHRWLGVGLATLVTIAWLAAFRERGRLYAAALLGSLAVLGPVGHFGGVMTHGPTFLTEAFRPARSIPMQVEQPAGPITYETHIASFLEAYCVSCHGESRQRGGLAVHDQESLRAGGDYGPVVFPNDPKNSELLSRLMLDPDDDLRMPPAGRTQPSESEIELVARWIREGAR